MFSCCRCGTRQSQGGRAALRNRMSGATRLDLAVLEAGKAGRTDATSSGSSAPAAAVGASSTVPAGRVFDGGSGVVLEQGDIYMFPQSGQSAYDEYRSRLHNVAGTPTTAQSSAPPNTPTTLASSPFRTQPTANQPGYHNPSDFHSRANGVTGSADFHQGHIMTNAAHTASSYVQNSAAFQHDLASGIQLPPLERPSFGRAPSFVGGFPVDSFGAEIAAQGQSQRLPVAIGGQHPFNEVHRLPALGGPGFPVPIGGLVDDAPKSFWETICCQRRYRPPS